VAFETENDRTDWEFHDQSSDSASQEEPWSTDFDFKCFMNRDWLSKNEYVTFEQGLT
jgi:hypothetical protein